MISYLARIEIINGYSNIRPVMEMMDGGLIEVEEEKFGQYGTITIGALYGAESPVLQDQKYCIFSITDSELSSLEQTTSGYKIRAQDFIKKCKPVDSSAIRELISLPITLVINDYYKWGKDSITLAMPPITKTVYLSDETQVFGPFLWEQSSSNQYKFSPNASADDPYVVKCYKKADFDEPIYTFDAAKRASDLLYGQIRHVIKIDAFPEKSFLIDCIDDSGLKDFVGRILAQPLDTKKEKREIREAIAALPMTLISEDRKRRILELVKNGEIADQAMSSIISDVFRADDEATVTSIVEKILGNANYSDRLLQIARRQGDYQKILDVLEREKVAKEAELKELAAKIENTKNQSVNSTTGSSEEIERLTSEIEVLKKQLTSYKQVDEARVEYEKSLQLCQEAENQFKTFSKLTDDLETKIKQKVQSAYTDLAFDGALSSLMLQEAAQFERAKNLKKVSDTVAILDRVENHSFIIDPHELIEFLYQELSQKANRTFTKNDIANIVICLAHGFLTILAGDPGTGKTSLVSLVSTILGLNNPNHIRYTEIAVEKGWSSRRDLIGYYNPLTKSFDAANKCLFTALATLNAEAEKNVADFPYLVLLDEANLSQMEHYWADFMSLCDFDKAWRKISLSEDYEFKIPNTLRFIATINIDHTTEILSPRLIDRAWIIKLQTANLDIDDISDSVIDGFYPMIGYSVFQKMREPQFWGEHKLDAAISDKFNKIRLLCQNVGIGFSPRVIGMIKRYCLAGKQLMDASDNSYVALDYAVAQKILPMIDGYGEIYQKFLDELLNFPTSKSGTNPLKI